MIVALVSSGRSSFVTSRLTNCAMPRSAAASSFSTAALPPCAATGSKPVVRTVITLTGSCDCTIAIALPA
ncbi:hypothetical protein LMG29542_08586 [Paraburkholderia humisilvae]|uniref:Uncharacterized protein n=1 Tax=Paraburkholderia humisilvae TaxID=627669 RepID=A0A6J5F9Q1_9BURK|nr:hypothetical protein LMG29542_08586 [Paraburkholderia humisilvae]